MVFLKISQNSLENTSARVSFLIKLQAWGYNFIKKKDSGKDVFSVNFLEFLRTPYYRTRLVAAS